MDNFFDKVITTVREKRVFFLLAIPFILILLFLVFAIITLQSSSKDSTTTQTPASSPTPSDTPAVAEEKVMQQQERGDKLFEEEQAAIKAAYPWIEKLPLQTDTYFFYFDVEKKSFVGLLYPNSSSTVSIDNQVSAMKEEITAKIASLNIDVSNLPFDWQVTPKP